ncbi:ribonuclease H-like domain-containing protein [Tanacetum coccineum]
MIKAVVSDNQSAFILGRRISDNILLTHELMNNYHRDRGPPRCAFKVGIQKAYDTVDWRFLENILTYFGFPTLMVKWIIACVMSASFSLNVQWGHSGYFQGKRGLRQGDPISPYLFTLVMEVLTLIIKRRARVSNTFRYHKHCEELRLLNVCFADDLFLFVRGEVDSARLIMEALDEFQKSSGLIRGFLWCNGEQQRGKAKVAWDTIYLPKREGAVDSLDIYSKGYNLQNCVVDLATNGGWSWPQAWLLKSPNIALVPAPNLVESRLDVPQWRDYGGKFSDFLLSVRWEAVLDQGVYMRVTWATRIVGFISLYIVHGYAISSLMDTAYWTSEQ